MFLDEFDHIIKDFYPRPPRGGRPLTVCLSLLSVTDFYPRPPRGGRPDSAVRW